MIRPVVAVAVALMLGWTAPARAPAPAPSVEVFEALILARVSAFADGDAGRYAALLGEGFVHVSDAGVRRSGAEIPAHVRSHGGHGAAVRYRVEALNWRPMGTHVLVDAVMVEQAPAGTARWVESNLFRVQDGRWLLVHHQETPVVEPARAIAVDAAVLAGYAGRYDYGGGLVDTVSLEGDVLRVSDGGPPARLVAVAPDAFRVADASGVLVFLRDRTGQVAGQVFVSPNGQVANSRKLP